jgi:hypothetical protein
MTKARSKGCARGCGKKKRGRGGPYAPLEGKMNQKIKDKARAIANIFGPKKQIGLPGLEDHLMKGGNWFKSQLDPNSVTRTHIVPALGMFGGPMGKISTLNSVAKFFGKGKRKGSKRRSHKKR